MAKTEGTAVVLNTAKRVSEVAEIFAISEGVIRNAIAKPIVGQVYVEGFVNIEELRSYLVKKFTKEECDSKLGFDVNELTIVKGVRSEAHASVKIEDLEVGSEYVLRNYHFETNAKFVGDTNVNGTELWIFLTDKGYKAYSKVDLDNGHFKIIAE